MTLKVEAESAVLSAVERAAAERPAAGQGRLARLWGRLGHEQREVLRGSLAGVVTRMVDVPSRYGFHYLVAQRLGVYQTGLFYLAFGALNLLCGAGRIGVDYAMTRDVSASLAAGEIGLLRRVTRKGFMLVFAFSIATTLFCLAIAGPLSTYVFEQPELLQPFRLLALTILPVNLSVAAAGVLAGLKRVARSQVLYGPLWPALWCIGALMFNLDIDGAIHLLIVAQLLTALTGLVMFWRALPALPPRTEPSRQKVRLFALGWSLFVAETVQLVISTAPILLLGRFETPEEVGRFAIANRLTMIVTVVVYGIAGIASSKFAELKRLGDPDRLVQAVRIIALVVMALTVPILAIMFLFPETVMGMIGHAFVPGAPLIRILAGGYMTTAIFATMPILLGMTGHERDLRNINYGALVCLLVSGAALIPNWGAPGAAAATALTVAFNSVLCAVMVRRRLGINPLILFGGLSVPKRAGEARDDSAISRAP